MKTERVISLVSEGIGRMREVYATARILGKTNEELNNASNDIYCHLRLLKTPRYAISQIRGYEMALRDELYSRYLIFGAIVNNVFYSTHSDRDDYYQKHGIPASAYCEATTNNPTIGHYWKENGKPFFTDGMKK